MKWDTVKERLDMIIILKETNYMNLCEADLEIDIVISLLPEHHIKKIVKVAHYIFSNIKITKYNALDPPLENGNGANDNKYKEST